MLLGSAASWTVELAAPPPPPAEVVVAPPPPPAAVVDAGVVLLLPPPPQATRASVAMAASPNVTNLIIDPPVIRGSDVLYPASRPQVHGSVDDLPVQRPWNVGWRPSRNAVTPSRRSSVAMLSAIPWRSSCRCSVRLFSSLRATRSLDIRTQCGARVASS